MISNVMSTCFLPCGSVFYKIISKLPQIFLLLKSTHFYRILFTSLSLPKSAEIRLFVEFRRCFLFWRGGTETAPYMFYFSGVYVGKRNGQDRSLQASNKKPLLSGGSSIVSQGGSSKRETGRSSSWSFQGVGFSPSGISFGHSGGGNLTGWT